ncbi:MULTISPECIES: cytochrome c oxidase assembly protein [unclassified Paenibacillus]|uniref:cytochrome c oxidase assembly protein n=1 Tax=unclassified Paenibacillus TaxID=185978 RepID=UPI001AE75C4B|nr:MULTISPECIES: cytochrome c oxidase assembly protein [unclassified Paenibacillus]MBP1157571.1 putative membrane protein [Paenibacillus sp. PvP091]MBP1171692.1 putative membrane protein [Paenibacillus sp. PvR098]MBP2438073.1 putative membrane protein [Paenibacillus sp. PvP052]
MDTTVSHAGHGNVPTFVQLWSPGFLLVMIVLGVLYMLAVGRWRSDFANSEPVTLKQKLWFWSGLALWYAADGSPMSYYAHHYLFSIHMFQQSILYLIMPPMLLLGTPGWLLRAALKGEGGKRFMRWFTAPLFSLFFFNFIFSMYHIPMVMDWLMAHATILVLYKAIFLFAAFQMWFPVFCPLPEYNTMSDLKKMAYIFINGILLTPACALIIFAREPLYDMYATISLSYWLLPMIDDQQLGGVIMKIVQEVVYGLALGYVFFHWYRTERKQDDEEELMDNSYISSGNPNRV